MPITHTRKALRRRVLRRFGDLVVATATANGTTTTFTDTETLYGESSRYAGRHAYVAGGTAANLGKVRYVEGYNGTTQTLTFQTALPAATAEGDEIELTNAFGMGVTHDLVHEAINWAIALSRPYALEPAETDLGTFDGLTPLALPSEWAGVESVHYQHPLTDAWHPVQRARKQGKHGWAVDHANRTLTITGHPGARLEDVAIKAYGWTEPGELSSDSDETSVDLEWLVDTAVAHLMLDVVRSRQGAEWANQGLYYEDRADKRRAALTPQLGPSYTRI